VTHNPLPLFVCSAGGGLSVGLVFALLEKNLPPPNQLFLISPWLDVTNSVPNIAIYRRWDPWLHPETLLRIGMAWSRGDTKSLYCSPLLGDLSLLTKAKMKVTLCSGTYDYLYTNALEWVKKGERAGLECTFVSAERCVHVYPLLGLMLPPILVPEGIEALTRMIKAVEGYSKQSKASSIKL
jgi:acetyl esterase/lipase